MAQQLNRDNNILSTNASISIGWYSSNGSSHHHYKRYIARAVDDCCALMCVVARNTLVLSINELCFPFNKLDWRIMWRFDVARFLYCCCYGCYFSFLSLVLPFSTIVIFNRNCSEQYECACIVVCYYWKQYLIGIICFCLSLPLGTHEQRIHTEYKRIFIAPKWTQTFIDCSENRAKTQNRAIYSL